MIEKVHRVGQPAMAHPVCFREPCIAAKLDSFRSVSADAENSLHGFIAALLHVQGECRPIKLHSQDSDSGAATVAVAWFRSSLAH